MQNLNRSPKASNPLPLAMGITLVVELEPTWEEEIGSQQLLPAAKEKPTHLLRSAQPDNAEPDNAEGSPLDRFHQNRHPSGGISDPPANHISCHLGIILYQMQQFVFERSTGDCHAF